MKKIYKNYQNKLRKYPHIWKTITNDGFCLLMMYNYSLCKYKLYTVLMQRK